MTIRSGWPGATSAETTKRTTSSKASACVCMPIGPLDQVIHRGRHAQPRLAGAVHEDAAPVAVVVDLGDERVGEGGGGAGVGAGRRPLLVGHQLGLHDDREGLVDRLDDVLDRRHRALGQRHQPGRADPDPAAGGGDPLDRAAQRPRPHVEQPLVLDQRAVAQIERLVLDEQADDLAVGDVDHRLAGLGIAVAGLGVGQRAGLIETAEVGAGQAVGLALVEVAAQAEVAVGQREHRFGLGQGVEVKLGLADRPRLDREGRALDHASVSSSSARSLTTTLAPCARSPSA